jgi:hypothetical protein
MKLPFFLKKYFWDIDFNTLDLKKDHFYIITRLLEYGNIKAIRWLFKNTSQSKIKETILKSRELSPKTVNFWNLFFNLDKSKIQCLKKSYRKMQSTHWHN